MPHPETHKKAYLISAPALLIYLLLFMLLQTSLSVINNVKPGVLGINSSVDQKTLIDLTNKEREKAGLPDVKENPELDTAALAKAKNMFEENYWAHYSPSGKDPWGFITGAGYKFSYAGENLARNFYTSSDVMAAWMASPSHRANIVNSHYQDIGMAVLDGVLQGQKTTLIVQEFGTPVEAIAQTPEIPTQSVAQSNPNVLGTPNQVLVDPYTLEKTVGFSLIAFLMILILLDLYIIRRRAVLRVTSRHLSHLAILSIATTALFNMHPGGIL